VESLPIPKDPEWRTLHGVANQQQQNMRRAFQRGIAQFADKITIAELQRAFEAGDLGAVEAAIPWGDLPADLEEMADVILDTVENGAKASLRHLPDAIQANLRFDLLNPHSVEFIRQYRFNLIRQVGEQTQMAIRAIIERAFQEGLHPYRSARLIKPLVGLTERHGRAVMRYYAQLLADGVTLERADVLAKRYANRLHNYRARNIARTETMRAANAGQQLLWEQGVEEGLINPARTMREWIVTPDDRLCKFCEPMDTQKVGMDEDFQSDLGPVHEPPLHPSCRCAISLHFLDN
jgi:hypothetical protein